ncbi:YdeI/OmpD-associated family protein [Candidatus Bathyarchaeota archaeon]|nr:YdeI/OmpD-associated family protein [Candidatus Bathyarchaeota archaeon]
MDNALSFKDRENWRKWLEKNYDKESHIWLALYKKGSGKKGITLEESVEEAMCFGWIDGKLKRLDAERFILRFSPRKANSVWSKINKERAEALMKSGKMTEAGLAKIEEAKKTGLWDNAYTNKTKEAIPLDLKEALMKDKKAWDNFQNFANSYRNMYIGWVNNAKTTETRVKRIKKIVEQSLLDKKLVFL